MSKVLLNFTFIVLVMFKYQMNAMMACKKSIECVLERHSKFAAKIL
jgi:hypothetical protein